ncbi:MAG: hypothetical protein LPK02_13330 [Rhodobacterales bacterium]|jgi:hypothetical protein|nr:hypothetical protein [Rhodobacterales bacterium]MDX5501604.1 hypothetical protein [Rhodobacterales bacterium]
MKTLRVWRKICMPNASSLRAISLCRDAAGLWVGFTEVSPEAPDLIVYLPLDQMAPMPEALDRAAARDDRRYLLVPCAITGMDGRGKPARLNGAAYMRVCFRYRAGLVFNGPDGIWTVTFASSRHARLVARLLRHIHRTYNGAAP